MSKKELAKKILWVKLSTRERVHDTKDRKQTVDQFVNDLLDMYDGVSEK